MFPQKELELHFQAVLCGFGEYQCHAQIQNVCYPPVMNGILFFFTGKINYHEHGLMTVH